MTYKNWLDNEYQLWAEALNASTVNNFREHPQVKRMLGEIESGFYDKEGVQNIIHEHWNLLNTIQGIGFPGNVVGLSGQFIRMVYWALEVLKKSPKSICEIGGGVGEFYAILRALGYEGEYYIYDLDPVREFQKKFLEEVENLTGLNTELINSKPDFCVSFYALGEFDDELKQRYITNVVNHCEHGLIVWNPHSGASHEINIAHALTIVEQQDGTFKITW